MRESQTKERTIEEYLKKHVKGLGGMVLKLAPFHVSGIPDRLVLLPGGRAVFVEVKRPKGGVISKIQKYVHTKLEGLGFPVQVLNTKESIQETFKS